MTTLRSMAKAGIDLVFPPSCSYCQKVFESHVTPPFSGLCTTCSEQLHPIKRPFCEHCGEPFASASEKPFACSNCRGQDYGFEFAIAAYHNKDIVHDLIVGLKYANRFDLQHTLARLMARTLDDPRFEGWEPTLVPVPLHYTRKFKRGYNQSREIALQLSKLTGFPLSECLRRRLPTSSQTHLNRAARLENLHDAFAPALWRKVPKTDILLVDDVFTTGATATACTRALLKAGAQRVAIITVARS